MEVEVDPTIWMSLRYLSMMRFNILKKSSDGSVVDYRDCNGSEGNL